MVSARGRTTHVSNTCEDWISNNKDSIPSDVQLTKDDLFTYGTSCRILTEKGCKVVFESDRDYENPSWIDVPTTVCFFLIFWTQKTFSITIQNSGVFTAE